MLEALYGTKSFIAVVLIIVILLLYKVYEIWFKSNHYVDDKKDEVINSEANLKNFLNEDIDIDELTRLITKNEIEAVLNKLSIFLMDKKNNNSSFSNFYKRILRLSNRWRVNQYNSKNNLINFNDSSIEHNKIVNTLIEILSEIKILKKNNIDE